MVMDGLRADFVRPDTTPCLWAIRQEARFFPGQRSVFPSATRISSASIATGCHPGSHGLAGNAIALDEGDGLVPVSVGPATFRERWRKATGRTLWKPTLTERLRNAGGVSIYTNSSPGAAHMQDPDGHGWLRHRAGSHAPGFVALTGAEHLEVEYDAAGDRITIERFCRALSEERHHPLHVTWICEPDHSQHVLELGSPEHLEVLAEADARAGEVFESVRSLRADGDDVLFVLASDHGHETTDEIVPVNDLLVEAGFKQSRDSNDVVFVSSGMGALVYLSEAAMTRRDAIATWVRAQTWSGEVFSGDEELAAARVPIGGGLAIAIAMRKSDAPNRYGVAGTGAVATDVFSPAPAPEQLGVGQHGGLGRYETNPMLMAWGGGFKPGDSRRETSTIDIAPTILSHLDVVRDGMDGIPLPKDD